MNGLIKKFTSNFSNTNMRFFRNEEICSIKKQLQFRDLAHLLSKIGTYRRWYIEFCDAGHLSVIEGGVIFYRCERRVNKYSKLRRNAEKTEKERIS